MTAISSRKPYRENLTVRTIPTTPKPRQFSQLVKPKGAFKITDTVAFGEVVVRKGLYRGAYSVYVAPFQLEQRVAGGNAEYLAKLLETPQ